MYNFGNFPAKQRRHDQLSLTLSMYTGVGRTNQPTDTIRARSRGIRCATGEHIMRNRRDLFVTPKWATAIEAFDAELKLAGRPRSTRRLRCYQLRSFAHDHQDREPWNITRPDLSKWLVDQDWQASTQRSFRSALRLFYRWGLEAGYVETDPAATLPTIKVPIGLPRPAPDDVVDTGLRHPDELVRMAVWVMALTGIRRAECAELNKDWLIYDLRGWSLRIVGKGGRIRDVPIDGGMAQALLSSPSHWAFPGQIDGHISATWLGKLISRALPGKWTAHTLRHRFGTLIYRETHDIRTVQELLGHARVTTAQVYTLVDDEAKRAAIVGARRGLRMSGAHMAHGARPVLSTVPAADAPPKTDPAVALWLLLTALRPAGPAAA